LRLAGDVRSAEGELAVGILEIGHEHMGLRDEHVV
jgi:hypothetical protein